MNLYKGKIVVLPEDLTNRIAAGEVVERPSSIVKELIENSLDAGATDIVIELEKGGKESIKVVDNGEGISSEDVILAFERYATSKIYTFDDIYKVKSFGFRGEALPSIASISRVELITKREGSLSGTRAIVEGGEVKEVVATGSPIGTSVLVRDIFYSVPVRRKFLKKDSTEQGHCVDVITKLALPHPDVRINVMANGKMILNIPKTRDLPERISLVLGGDLRKSVLYVEGKGESVRLRGFISKPYLTRSNTKGMLYYVNRRFIRDGFLNHAVMTSYRKLIETKRYPSVVLFLDFSPEDVDVNVHPAKMEVRFRNPKEVYEVVVGVLARTLAGISPVSSISTFTTPERGDKEGPQRYLGRVEEALKRYTISSSTKKPFLPPFSGKESSPAEQTGMWGISEEKGLSFSSLEYIGQVAATYLVFSSPDGIVLLDQHAAHERVLFEKIKMGCPREKITSQRLLIPEIVSLPPVGFDLLMEYAEVLEEVGVEVEPYGGNTVVVKSVPAVLSDNIEPKSMLLNIVEEFSNAGKFQSIEEARDKIFTLLSCKSAIKANHRLTESEADNLCKELDSTPFASTCPHGRPTYVQLNIKDLEKMFRRR